MKKFAVVFALLAVVCAGCATHKIMNVPVASLENYKCHTSSDDYEVAVDVYDDVEKTKQAFYDDLNKRHYFPIHVMIKNNSSNRLLVDRNEIVLTGISGQEFKHVDHAAMCDEFEHNKMAYALLGFGIFSYASADEANEKMQADWAEKELPKEMIVDSGRLGSGFAYIKLPEGLSPEGMKLSFQIENMETKDRQTITMQL